MRKSPADRPGYGMIRHTQAGQWNGRLQLVALRSQFDGDLAVTGHQATIGHPSRGCAGRKETPL